MPLSSVLAIIIMLISLHNVFAKISEGQGRHRDSCTGGLPWGAKVNTLTEGTTPVRHFVAKLTGYCDSYVFVCKASPLSLGLAPFSLHDCEALKKAVGITIYAVERNPHFPQGPLASPALLESVEITDDMRQSVLQSWKGLEKEELDFRTRTTQIGDVLCRKMDSCGIEMESEGEPCVERFVQQMRSDQGWKKLLNNEKKFKECCGWVKKASCKSLPKDLEPPGCAL